MKFRTISVSILTGCLSFASASAQDKVVVVSLFEDCPAPAATSFTNSIGMTFSLVPAGTFIMGSPTDEPGRSADESQHQVTLTKPFYLQVTEVTQQHWQEVIGNMPATSNSGDQYPIETVNWFEAAYFANALSEREGRSKCYTLAGCSPIPGNGMVCTGVNISTSCTGYRLPTEAQWEYAARAGTTTAYANPYSFDATNTERGDGFNANLAAMGWYFWNDTNSGYASGTKPVAQKQANLWDLYDMHRNVYEWCQDWYGDDYYTTSPVTDPQGPTDGSDRVMRGGGWGSEARFHRSAERNNYSPGNRSQNVGFRLALPAGP
jgi:formylglycine-generating enzyme required for sulfatase activity